MLVREDGPWEVFAKLRNITGVKYTALNVPYGTNLFSSLLVCVWCTSVWVGAALAILEKPKSLFNYIQRALALSALAIILDEVINFNERE